ncbi:MAG: hypothetical protein ACYDDS_07150 [Candidatus Sulfotelmatobacter sp.]
MPDTQNKQRELTVIKQKLDAAEHGKVALPPAQLADYKNAVRAAPKSASEYWTTIAAIINYQSFIDQIQGYAPDPSKVAGICSGLTNGSGGHNLLRGGMIQNCVVDLDTNSFIGMTFKNSVIRYSGGKVILTNVRFENCRFILNISSDIPTVIPTRDHLLFALLQLPTLRNVQIQSTQ